MARVLAISSQVVYGPVGNTAAVPALQALGHEVMQVPTVVLSHHPGHGKPAGQATSPALLDELLKRAGDAGAFEQCDAVMTGYFASAEQVDVVGRHLPSISARVVLVDPVIGGEGGLYVPEVTAAAIRDILVPNARILTPNLFELNWLCKQTSETVEQVVAAAAAFGADTVLVTSAPADIASKITTVLVTPEGSLVSTSEKLPNVPHGTGDLLSGLFLAYWLRSPPRAAFEAAMETLNRAIALSAGSAALQVSEALAAPRPRTAPDRH